MKRRVGLKNSRGVFALAWFKIATSFSWDRRKSLALVRLSYDPPQPGSFSPRQRRQTSKSLKPRLQNSQHVNHKWALFKYFTFYWERFSSFTIPFFFLFFIEIFICQFFKTSQPVSCNTYWDICLRSKPLLEFKLLERCLEGIKEYPRRAVWALTFD